MEHRLYRKAAIDRLSSPEDLDRLLTVTDGRQWLVLLGVGIFVLTALTWSILTRVPTKTKGQGILIGQGGVLNVVTMAGGVVSEFHLKIGARVRVGDVIATISQPETATQIQQAGDQIDEEKLNADRSIRLQEETTRLQLAALERQRVSVEGDIRHAQEMEKIATEQTQVEEHLLERGLTTRQQVNVQRQKLVQMQSEEQKARAQLGAMDAQRFTLQSEPEVRRREAATRIDELKRRLEVLRQQMMRSAKVVSPFSGTVVELKVYEGSNVSAGTAVLSVQPDIEQLEVVAYVPTSEAKRIAPDMKVEISPTIVKREEFGFLRGRVVYVSDFPTTDAAAMRTFENQSLVNSLREHGLTNEIRVVIERAPDGGLQWSSRRTPLERMSSGTLCRVEVITRQRRAIELVMPYLKRSLNVD